ncbi:MAG: hypothetical protein J2P45_22970, partial [Candidatus Dormibacteraeota bacterium]|nr:hypothetical protein [Candidatus Dormibacteraeota bacterium]
RPAGRARLPTCVVRMRSVLLFISVPLLLSRRGFPFGFSIAERRWPTLAGGIPLWDGDMAEKRIGA